MYSIWDAKNNVKGTEEGIMKNNNFALAGGHTLAVTCDQNNYPAHFHCGSIEECEHGKRARTYIYTRDR